MELTECVDGLSLAFVCSIRSRAFQHADERECCGCEDCAAEGDRTVAGVAVIAPQRAL
jgi:hypothetical protein